MYEKCFFFSLFFSLLCFEDTILTLYQAILLTHMPSIDEILAVVLLKRLKISLEHVYDQYGVRTLPSISVSFCRLINVDILLLFKIIPMSYD